MINPELVSEDFKLIETSIRRAKLPFEVNMHDNIESLQVSAYECIKSAELLSAITDQIRNHISQLQKRIDGAGV